jgi:hypothetical protein
MTASALARRTLIAATLAAWLGSPAWGQPIQTGLDGEWTGVLENVSGPGVAPPPDGAFPSVRLQIDQRNARVWFGDDEVKAGTFEIRRDGTNAVISSIESDAGSPPGRSWIETWTFVVTLAGPDTLVVNFVRVVNNNNMRPSEDGAHFSQIRTGQFRRVAR